MKVRSTGRAIVLGVVLTFMATAMVPAAEIITEEDLRQEIITEEHLVRVADNALFLFDGSTSMRRPYMDTGMSRYEAVLKEFKARNSYMPEIGHKFGLYLYTPWTEVYPMQAYNRDRFAGALDTLAEKPKGSTLLKTGMEKAEEIIKGLSGKTALFVFTDGSYGGEESSYKAPIDTAKRMISNHDVCIYVISTAKEKRNIEMTEKIAELNSCSRVVPLSNFLNRPEYTTGALLDVKATEEIVTITDQKITGLVADDVNFEFDKDDLQAQFAKELEEVGSFLKEYAGAFVTLQGYTDNVGSSEYNMKLSEQRAQRVADYLVSELGIDENRIVLQWYGYANPVASNDTEEGRARNRRVEMAIGGM